MFRSAILLGAIGVGKRSTCFVLAVSASRQKQIFEAAHSSKQSRLTRQNHLCKVYHLKMMPRKCVPEADDIVLQCNIICILSA